MQRLFCILCLVLVIGCQDRGTQVGGSSQQVPDSVLTRRIGSMARIRKVSDSLVLAALIVEGARLEYRWVVDAPPGDSTGIRVFDPESRKWLTLNDTVVLDLPRAQAVEVSHTPDHSFVRLHLDMVVGDRFLSTTNRHLRHRLAITLNGQLLAAPVIATPWAGDVPVAVELDSAVADELASRLRGALPARTRPDPDGAT